MKKSKKGITNEKIQRSKLSILNYQFTINN
jgi:hypothetical protein